MTFIFAATALAGFLLLAFVAWKRYLWAAEAPEPAKDTSPYGLTDTFGDDHLINVPHQKGVRWLTEVFSRSAARFPHLTALHIAHSGESFTFAELDAQAERIAAAVAPFLTGPDQVVAIAMVQDSSHVVAAHLGILKAGGAAMYLDTSLPDALMSHMLGDAQPVVVLTRGEDKFRDCPTLDVSQLPESMPRRKPPAWMDDPAQRLATIFYTSGTTGMPKGVECPHAGYVNLALSYADYFGLVAGMDATSLTSSLGYDGSISEMYSAWVAGCAVIMLTKEQVRSGPDLVTVLREAEVTVLFCPPVLLTTLTSAPEIDLPYPICRYIVPAGEAFPNALVGPWTRGRRQIVNTYGPTEASTDTSRQSLRPGEPVTIGPPFPNVTYLVLDPDGLEPLPHGKTGELCIGGVHVVRGYRNLPELTAEKFIMHPQFGRLYRTGDSCKIDARTQRVHFLGRIDAQLKVRGHRVEVQPVEDMLQTQFSEVEAAVLDYQNEALIAFVAAPSLRENGDGAVTAAPARWAARVTAALAEQLPAPSVPTRIFLIDKFTMKPLSGKIDRTSLPKLSHIPAGAAETALCTVHNSQATKSPAEKELKPDAAALSMSRECQDVLAICRPVFATDLGPDDGFAQSGGHSLLIARLAQQLQAAGWTVAVRALLSDCNTARKVASRPRVLQREGKLAIPVPRSMEIRVRGDEAAARVLPIGYFTTLQVLFAGLVYFPAFLALIVSVTFIDIGTFFTTAGFWQFVGAGLLLYLFALLSPFAALIWAMTIKLFMGGDIRKNNVTPGVYPKWSRMHLRIWCIGRLENVVLLTLRTMYRSAPLLAFAVRQLGATVGKNLQCAHDAHLSGPVDLISIEDDVAIQTGAYLQTATWSGQSLRLGSIHLASECKIGMRAAVCSNVSVGRGSWIAPFTPILASVGSQEMWEGAPARLAGRCTQLRRTGAQCRYASPVWLLEIFNIFMQVFASACLVVVPAAVIAWLTAALLPAGNSELSEDYFAVTPLFEIVWELVVYGFMTGGLTIVATSLLACLFIRCTAAAPGLYPSCGLKAALLMYKMQLLNRVQRQWTWTITGQYLRALAGMRFARVGASECDLMFNLVPEVTTADPRVFWSNGCFTNMLDYGAEHLQLRQLDLPRNFFSGNNSVAEHGHFPSNFLLGVSTPASEIDFRRQMWTRPGDPITVAGNPPVRFASTAFDTEIEPRRLPTFPLFLTRVFLFDFFSIGILPITEGLAFTILYICLSRWTAYPLASAAAAFALAGGSLVLFCAGAKKCLVGGQWGIDSSTPFWSWRHFAYFFAQDCFFVWCRGPLAFCAGTVLANSILRRMGCRIGKRTLITQPMQCSDWNAVQFGNECVVDGFLQFHSFEDMLLKVKRTSLEDRSTISLGATVMGGAGIEPDTTLLPLSLVLKEMKLITGTYQGSPAEPVDLTVLPAVSDAAGRSPMPALPVDNTDWLKIAAVLMAAAGHTGYFFMENDYWWGASGRLAAPIFFFFLGYARTRSVPLQWIWLGLLLTLLESWNADWRWVPLNVLLSFGLIRSTRPYIGRFLDHYGWIGFAVVASLLVAVLLPADKIFDYGAEGWLWALFGLIQRRYVDDKGAADNAAIDAASPAGQLIAGSTAVMRLMACSIAALVYIWAEQKEFSFPPAPFALFVLGLGVLSTGLCFFQRRASPIQPPSGVAAMLHLIGQHTLEIYAIQLAAFELAVKLVPDLAP